MKERLKRYYADAFSRTHGSEKSDKAFYPKACWGKILTLKINVTLDKKRTWISIGEICKKCGAVAIFKEFQKGVPKKKELKELLEKRKVWTV